jgi:hypothetical protein
VGPRHAKKGPIISKAWEIIDPFHTIFITAEADRGAARGRRCSCRNEIGILGLSYEPAAQVSLGSQAIFKRFLASATPPLS